MPGRMTQDALVTDSMGDGPRVCPNFFFGRGDLVGEDNMELGKETWRRVKRWKVGIERGFGERK